MIEMDLITSPVFRLSKMEVDSDLDMGEFGLRAASVHGNDLSGGSVKLTSGDATVDADGVATLESVGSCSVYTGWVGSFGSKTLVKRFRMGLSGDDRFVVSSGDFILRLSISFGASSTYAGYGGSSSVKVYDSIGNLVTSLSVSQSSPVAFVHLGFVRDSPLEFELSCSCSVTNNWNANGTGTVTLFANRSVHESVGCYGIPADDLDEIVSGVGLSLEEVIA